MQHVQDNPRWWLELLPACVACVVAAGLAVMSLVAS
jgi:hypothetical protein